MVLLKSAAFLVVLSVLPATMHSQPGNSVLMEYQDEVSAYCETEVFNATCPPDHVIVMTHALYGRMRFSRCVRLDYGHIGCSSDVILALDARCSGRLKCEIRIPDGELSKNKPCPEDLKPYLEASYRCVKVVWPSAASCDSDTAPPPLTLPSATLASVVSEVANCGRVMTPWRIDVPKGQTIHVTLHDFGVYLTRRRFSSPKSKQVTPQYPGQRVDSCLLYAVLWEPIANAEGNVSICGGNQRLVSVYSSRTNRLDIGISRVELGRSVVNYLLEYQAVGCADLPSSPNSMTVRSGDGTTIWCNFTRDIYHLKCSAGTWVGDLPNCSSSVLFGFNSENVATATSIPTYGMSVAIVLVIAIFIGNLILFAGTILLRRRRRRCPSMSDCRHSISMSDGSVLNKRRIEATLIRNDDGMTYFDPGLYSATKATQGGSTGGLDPPQTRRSSDQLSKPITVYDSLPCHHKRRALLSHLPCGCRAYADDTDVHVGTYLRQQPICTARLRQGALHRNLCRSSETLTGISDNSIETKRIRLQRQNSTPPASVSLPCSRPLDPSIIRWTVTGRHTDHPERRLQRPRSSDVESRVRRGRVNVDDDLPQVVTECRPLISVTAAAGVTHCCLYQSPSLAYPVATLPLNPPKTTTTTRFPPDSASSLKTAT